MLQYYNTFIENLTIFLLSVGKTENEKELDSRTTSGSDFKRRLTFFRFYLIKQTFFFHKELQSENIGLKPNTITHYQPLCVVFH